MPQAGRTHGKGAAAKLHNAEHLLIAVTVAGVNNRQRTATAKCAGNYAGTHQEQLMPRPLVKRCFCLAAMVFNKPLDGGKRNENAQHAFQRQLWQILQRKKNQSACQ